MAREADPHGEYHGFPCLLTASSVDGKHGQDFGGQGESEAGTFIPRAASSLSGCGMIMSPRGRPQLLLGGQPHLTTSLGFWSHPLSLPLQVPDATGSFTVGRHRVPSQLGFPESEFTFVNYKS